MKAKSVQLKYKTNWGLAWGSTRFIVLQGHVYLSIYALTVTEVEIKADSIDMYKEGVSNIPLCLLLGKEDFTLIFLLAPCC